MITLPLPVLRRLPGYLILLDEDRRTGRCHVSSTDWAARLGATPIQVRKDLAWTGAVGLPKKGFPIDKLEERIRACLGTDNRRDLFLVGTSDLGRGVAADPSLARHGFTVVGTFDPLARCLPGPSEKKALSWEKFADLVRRMGVSVVLLAVDGAQAQKTADKVAAAGIRTIWNLTGRPLKAPPGTVILEEDLGARLAGLTNQTAG